MKAYVRYNHLRQITSKGKPMFLRAYRKINRLLISLIMGSKKGLRLKKNVVFNGLPVIDISEGAEVTIDDGCVINSANKGYHVNMFSPVKLMADRKGAKIIIGKDTRVHGSCIHAYELIQIGNRCLIAANCQIIDGNGHELSADNVMNRINTTSGSSPVIIEDDVWICTGAIILPGVTIGRGSVVAAGSIVTKSIPPFCMYGGSPAKFIKSFANEANDREPVSIMAYRAM
ncbi:acyltransferase [Cronobacter dublinensis]|uniref:acyltransferase n=1 Tax=Cronobacter dublinensis TaxID=413497 RepID=UPI0024AF4ADE|nr:acyltransferase [Cronobacter dublinensis]MDI7494499.1 acyltransferase [Cronobacter dublinensis]